MVILKKEHFNNRNLTMAINYLINRFNAVNTFHYKSNNIILYNDMVIGYVDKKNRINFTNFYNLAYVNSKYKEFIKIQKIISWTQY